MPKLRFNVPSADLPTGHAHALLGQSLFEILSAPRDLRRLRSSLLDVARYTATADARRGILILDQPRITRKRLGQEWDSLHSIFRPEIIDRMAVVIHRTNTPDKILGKLTPAEQKQLTAVIDHHQTKDTRSTHRPKGAFFDILRVLLVHWVRKSGPLTSKHLIAQTGYSYPTVAGALRKLKPHLTRHSDRRIELKSFPREAWAKLLTTTDTVRTSWRYIDRSGRPRSPVVLLERLAAQSRDDIAVAGITGARHYCPDLDLVGTPRLDLLFHTVPGNNPDDVVRCLDPALKPAKRSDHPQLVVHALYRPESLFTTSDTTGPWADEIECLLDLHDMRLEPQALEFLDHLTPTKSP